MNEFIQWLSMGGYALYIWPAFFIVTISLLLNTILVNKNKKNVLIKLNTWLKRFE